MVSQSRVSSAFCALMYAAWRRGLATVPPEVSPAEAPKRQESRNVVPGVLGKAKDCCCRDWRIGVKGPMGVLGIVVKGPQSLKLGE